MISHDAYRKEAQVAQTLSGSEPAIAALLQGVATK